MLSSRQSAPAHLKAVPGMYFPTVITARRPVLSCQFSFSTNFTRRPPRPRLLASTAVSASSDQASSLRVVITGSTKGIGLAMAECFLSAGDRVLITSRSASAVDATVVDFSGRFGDECVYGMACNVGDVGQVEDLAAFARESLGGVDLWINNAGSNGYLYANLVDFPAEALAEIVSTNVLGSLLCSRAAIKLMMNQPGGGHVFNMEGAGSDGNPTSKYAAYGFSKAGMIQLAKSLATETKDLPVGVHTLSPGPVNTELVASGQFAFGKIGRILLNTIAETPEAVAEDLVPKLRDFTFKPGTTKSAKAIRFLTPDKAFKKFYARLVKGENKDRFFQEDASEK